MGPDWNTFGRGSSRLVGEILNNQTAIPQGVPVLSNLDIAVKYIPMESIGGDYYGFHIIDDKRIGILISDVTGHGTYAHSS